MTLKQEAKKDHKELERKANLLEKLRLVDRGSDSWLELRTLKKLKLKAKDKLYALKSKLHA